VALLAIYFHWPSPGAISLDLVIDLNDVPDWYQRPTGTWFETYGRDFEESWDEELAE